MLEVWYPGLTMCIHTVYHICLMPHHTICDRYIILLCYPPDMRSSDDNVSQCHESAGWCLPVWEEALSVLEELRTLDESYGKCQMCAHALHARTHTHTSIAVLSLHPSDNQSLWLHYSSLGRRGGIPLFSAPSQLSVWELENKSVDDGEIMGLERCVDEDEGGHGEIEEQTGQWHTQARASLCRLFMLQLHVWSVIVVWI